ILFPIRVVIVPACFCPALPGTCFFVVPIRFVFCRSAICNRLLRRPGSRYRRRFWVPLWWRDVLGFSRIERKRWIDGGGCKDVTALGTLQLLTRGRRCSKFELGLAVNAMDDCGHCAPGWV